MLVGNETTEIHILPFSPSPMIQLCSTIDVNLNITRVIRFCGWQNLPEDTTGSTCKDSLVETFGEVTQFRLMKH